MDSENGIILHQANYAVKVTKGVNRFHRVPMTQKLEVTGSPLNKQDHDQYRKIVGSLLYLVVGTRPDLSYAVSVLGQYVQEPTEECLKVALQVLGYVKTTLTVGLFYSRTQSSWTLVGSSDTDHCSDSNLISRYSYIILLGIHTIMWKSKKLPVRTLSSCESEFCGGTHTSVDLLYGSKLQSEILLCRKLKGDDITLVPSLKIDNKSTVKVLNTGAYHPVVRHIDIKNLWLIDKVLEGYVLVDWIEGEFNISDMGTKPLARTRLYMLMHLAMMRRLLFDGMPTPPDSLEGKTQGHLSLVVLSGTELVMQCVHRWNDMQW